MHIDIGTRWAWPWKDRRRLARVTLLGGGVFLLGFVLLGVTTVRVWEITNSVDFCTSTCHDIHPEEPLAYQASYHARVQCTECHMGRVSTFRAMTLKAGHAWHLPATLLGRYGRPVESKSMRPASESCEGCHWPAALHDDAAREIRRFLPDEGNTEQRTYFLLKTGGGARAAGQGYGIHWHISNRVEYIATDDHKQEIRWVRAVRPNGRTVEYSDVLDPLSPQEVAQAETRVMDCVDCHNRVGHPFPPPDELIDQALAEGQLSPGLPLVKQELLALLMAEYADQAEALAAADTLRDRYLDAYPEVAATYAAEIEQAVQVAKELVPRLVFQSPGITWQSFADNTGHKTSAGCFRCHDGKHVSQEGEAIPLRCGLCHSIPLTVNSGDDPPEMPIVSREEPASHLETAFLSDHRFVASDSCAECHGDIDYGVDDSSFCANSACHGREWPMVDLDAVFTHPVRLEGGHAEVRCYTCHQGDAALAYECASCHKAPEEPHYGTECQDCHTAAGFEFASAEGFLHPMALEGQHADLGCGSCHTTARALVPACASCHQGPPDHLRGSCETCHTATGWGELSLSAAVRGAAIPHAPSGGNECLGCHAPTGENWPAPRDHRAFTIQQCNLCHPQGEGAPVTIRHDGAPSLLSGEHVQVLCVACHGDGVFRGTPETCVDCHQSDDAHTGQLGQSCAQCHSPDGWAEVAFDHAQVAFPLVGSHAGARCVQCHPGGVYGGTPQTCYACHQTDDAHAGQFGQDCAQCHSPTGWAGASFDHNVTPFPLLGAHAGVGCVQCHPSGVYGGTPQTCYACHQTDDAHAGQFGQNCAQCHSPTGWAGASFDHNVTPFPLVGAHAGVGCVQCHPSGVYGGTPQTCYACHQADDAHAGQFGQNCAQCHSPTGWPGASFDHNVTPFPLVGAHVGVGCVQCHPGGVYGGTPQTCYACHQADDAHAGQFGQNCAQCHSPTGWAGASFDHGIFPLTGGHAGVACAQCHPGGAYGGTPQTCNACHGEPGFHAGVLGTECTTCHSTAGWLPAGYSLPHTFPTGHKGASSCRNCHATSLPEYTCYTCHNPGSISEKHEEEGIPDWSNCIACHPTGQEP